MPSFYSLHSFAFPPFEVLQVFFVKKDPSEVCSLSGWVMLGFASTHIHPITGWHSLSPISSARILKGVPCGSLAISGGDTGLPCFVLLTGQVRLRLFPGGI
jgi:hypothetical protein